MLNQSFIENIEKSLTEPLVWIKKAMNPLSEEQIWFTANENSNSVGVLCKHLSGNITQYVISCLGKNEDQRERAAEFVNVTIENPLGLLEETILRAKSVIQNLESLEVQYEVQGIMMSSFEILQHVTQHLYYHAGQIVYLSKMITNSDLNLYEGRDLNILNPRP